ncbi:hypothetical protein BWQ96_10520 [Gracilariopsis chorda]|uniref:Uncharacterized protein n=1 Tax=Gracilariopsis chorda TaxID=448386 RepID=A0A2V3ICE3_9FLOR|nr:hypothetical protein BWQ96_10520 [Gracilariopsis chorda]|eukprot:PXF39772.1 hypothetical protein BWQ96_10520 [Gracilariopsis chorda]
MNDSHSAADISRSKQQNLSDDVEPTFPKPKERETSGNDSNFSSHTKLKRFRFTETFDLFLLRAVRKEDPHIPKWGELESVSEIVLETFLKRVPSTVFIYMNHPSTKTLIDRFKRLVSMRKADNTRSMASSGIAKTYLEKESLLDDLILEMDERAEATRLMKEEQNMNEKRLIRAVSP